MTTLVTSRPVRSLVAVIATWVVLRVVVVASEDRVPDVSVTPSAITGQNLVKPATATVSKTPFATTPVIDVMAIDRPKRAAMFRDVIFPYVPHLQPQLIERSVETALGTRPTPSAMALPTILTTGTALPATNAAPSSASAARRMASWSGSVWILARQDTALPLGPAGQLGGSQAGARIYYTLNPIVSLTGRISAPIAQSRGAEASVGLAIRHKNVGVLLERRVGLDSGGRDAFSATAFGGFSNIALPHGVRLDGYGQAGFVGGDAFADGAIRVERTVVTSGKARLAVGAGVWGGAQPGVRRVDVGPQIVATLPIEGRNLRLSAEWRQRVEGNAAPSSGPSVTLGFDL